MKRLLTTTLSATLVLCACQHRVEVHPLAGTPSWQPDPGHATQLQNDEYNGNGIEVGAPKFYDDASLRMMLDATRAKLAGMTGLDQASLISRLGSISGATISQTQFGLQLTGGAGPGVSTTNTGATTQTTTNANLPEQNTSLPGSTTVTSAPTTSTTTTSPSPPAIPTVVPGIAFTPPSTISPSSLDVLNEQMQLSYEMTNLQLLLEGALSDRFVTNQRFIKPRVTIGFPISLHPPEEFKDAAAVVEVEVKTAPRNLADGATPEPPAITALLPREKTYNVAAMTDRMTSIGGGAVVGTVGLSGSFLSGHKTLYLVQDQDTVALQLPQGRDPNTTSFVWEFHPVIGEHYIRSGMKQTFVQLALPILAANDCFGNIRIRTYWRRFDQKGGVARDVIPESVLASTQTFSIPQFDLAPQVGQVEYEDLGDGTVMVRVKTNTKQSFLAGTYVQLGPNRYDAGKNLLIEEEDLKFVVPISAFARWTGHVVARSGESTDLLQPPVQTPVHQLQQTACAGVDAPPLPAVSPFTCPPFSIQRVTVTPVDETSSFLTIEIATSLAALREPVLVVIGGKVFGLKDAPVRRELAAGLIRIKVTVPTALLMSDAKIRVFRPFWSDVDGNGKHCFDDTYVVAYLQGPDVSPERLVLVSVDASGNAVYLLYGSDLSTAKLLVPQSGASLRAVTGSNPDRVQLLSIQKAALAGTKKIVLQKQNGLRPLVLDLPDAKGAAPSASVDSPVIQNTDELNVTLDNAADVTAVKLDDRVLKWRPVDDSTIRLLNLKAEGVTSEQKTREITIQYNNNAKTKVKFEVVAARIGVKQ